MPQQPMITVVVPMYNADKFIAKCLEHLTHQTYKHLEVIIVDDGSTDKSADIVKQYAKSDKRITLLRQKNSGPAVAQNHGLDKAHGQYIHFHDADDYVNLDYYEKMAAAATLTDADVLCGMVNQPSYQFPEFTSIEICTSMADKILKTRANDFNPAWRYLYKTKFLKQVGLRFEETTFHSMDWMFTKQAIVLAPRVACVPNAIYNVVDVTTSLGKKQNHRPNKPGFDSALEKYNKLMAEHGASQLIQRTRQPYQRITFKVFNRPIFRRDIWPNKTRYYLFGINIGTRYISHT